MRRRTFVQSALATAVAASVPVGQLLAASGRSTTKIAGDINAIIDHFGADTATIVGQDSGGLHAWHFAMTYPERTDRLISLGSAGHWTTNS